MIRYAYFAYCVSCWLELSNSICTIGGGSSGLRSTLTLYQQMWHVSRRCATSLVISAKAGLNRLLSNFEYEASIIKYELRA